MAVDKRDIFSICLSRKEDILIEDTSSGKIRSVIPDWIHAAGDTSSFFMLPVTFDKAVQAIIVGTVSNELRINLSDTDIKHLRSIRAKISKLYGMIEDHAVSTI